MRTSNYSEILNRIEVDADPEPEAIILVLEMEDAEQVAPLCRVNLDL